MACRQILVGRNVVVSDALLKAIKRSCRLFAATINLLVDKLKVLVNLHLIDRFCLVQCRNCGKGFTEKLVGRVGLVFVCQYKRLIYAKVACVGINSRILRGDSRLKASDSFR